MKQVTLTEATKHLSDLIDAAKRGELVVIVDQQNTQIQLVPLTGGQQPRRAGSAHGMIHIADDFDAPLTDFNEYMA